MNVIESVSTDLLLAAEVCGPKSKEPPYVRMAFPLLALPAVLRNFCKDASDAMGVPPECVAAPVLATCAAAIGATTRVRLNATWTEPAVLWAVTLMESGSLKTPAYNAAMEPLKVAQRLAEERYAQLKSDYKQAAALYESDVGLWKAQNPENVEGAPREPVEPVPIDYYTSDSTVEALAMLFDHNPRGLALTRDELSGFFASFGAYKGGRGGDEATYLEFYNAGSVKLNRASGKRIYVHSAALSIFGTCQPAVFAKAIGVGGQNANQVDNGLAARFLVVCPETRPKRWHDAKQFTVAPYWTLVAGLLALPLPVDEEGRTMPAMVELQPDARRLLAQFVNEHGEQTAAISNAALRYHYAKLEAVAARLALILHMCEEQVNPRSPGGGGGISATNLVRGIVLARWFGREALRIYDGYESAAEREMREVLEEVRDHGGVITIRELSRLRKRWNDPLAAEMALRNLARNGYGTLHAESPESGPGRPTLRFRIHKPVEEVSI